MDSDLLNDLLFQIFPVKRKRDPALPHHRLALVKFLVLAYRHKDNDGETVNLYPLLDQLSSEPGLAESFGFANGVPSERWVVLVHRKLVDDWEALRAVVPWKVCKPARIMGTCSDRSRLVARLKKLDAYGLANLVDRLFARKRKGPDPHERLPVVRALLASYDPDVKGLTNMTALVDALHEDATLRDICGFTDLVPDRSTFLRTLAVLEQDGNWQQLEELKHTAVNDRAVGYGNMGDWCVVDSTPLPAYCNPKRKSKRFRDEGCDPTSCEYCKNCQGDPDKCACAMSDPEGCWIKKHDARAPSGYVWVWGYKFHLMVDGESGNEIVSELTTGHVGDSPMLRRLFQKARDRFSWFGPELFLADRGYDGRVNVRFLNDQGTHTAIPKKKLGSGRFHHQVYNYQGVPTCEHGHLMQYVRTDAKRVSKNEEGRPVCAG